MGFLSPRLEAGKRFLVPAAVAVTTIASGCALTRADVKSLRDRDVGRVQFEAVIDTSVTALNALPSHCGPAGNRRIRDEEFHVYRIVGRIVRVRRERDHDVHIVLEDPANGRSRLVVELNDPDFRRNAASPFRGRLSVAGQMFDMLVGGSAGDPQKLRGILVRVTGVDFFDINHFQRGRSRSCIELHPVLGIERVLPEATLSH